MIKLIYTRPGLKELIKDRVFDRQDERAMIDAYDGSTDQKHLIEVFIAINRMHRDLKRYRLKLIGKSDVGNQDKFEIVPEL